MNLKVRLGMVEALRIYLTDQSNEWKETKKKAFASNGWFIEDFIDLAIKNIIEKFLNKDELMKWVDYYHLDDNIIPKKIGVVMAGNIPLVGFHDFLAIFISGHKQCIKLSSKDNILLKHITSFLVSLNKEFADYFSFEERLNGCDAYITTGSNNTSRYFEYYFGKYPSIIRKNKTSVAILNGNETLAELEKLADDICLYFGLGCRNVTKVYVPENYQFENFLNAFKKYSFFYDHKKYRNNYDYYLTLQIMNAQYYMTNNVIVLTENESIFSPISQVHYSFYKNSKDVESMLRLNEEVQCIVGKEHVPFGSSQQPSLFNYADGADTMAFLLSI